MVDALAPGHAHVTGECWPVVLPVDDEVMTFGLAADRLVDRRIEELVAFRDAKRGAKIGGILLAQAHEQRARAGEAHPVAALAEIMGERRDEAEPAARFLDPHVTRRSPGLVGNVLEMIALL